MIFKQAQQVLNGTKTQTRRPTKQFDIAIHQAPGYGELPIEYVRGTWGRLKWKVGRTYAVQPGQGKKSIGRIRITKIRRERLQEMTMEDLREEMGVNKDDPKRWAVYLLPNFIKLWNSLYCKPSHWEDNPEVWVLEFEGVQV